MNTPPYTYGGARAMVELHALHLRRFLEVWRQAQAAGTPLPASEDPDYASREALLFHVLACAAGYLSWICEQLELPAPALPERSTPKTVAAEAEVYMEGVLAAWELPLRGMSEEQAYRPAYPSRWETPYCLDAMMEHAVMHPIRHAHQLERLMGTS